MCGISGKVGEQNLTLVARNPSCITMRVLSPPPSLPPMTSQRSPPVDSREEIWFSASFTWMREG